MGGGKVIRIALARKMIRHGVLRSRDGPSSKRFSHRRPETGGIFVRCNPAAFLTLFALPVSLTDPHKCLPPFTVFLGRGIWFAQEPREESSDSSITGTEYRVSIKSLCNFKNLLQRQTKRRIGGNY